MKWEAKNELAIKVFDQASFRPQWALQLAELLVERFGRSATDAIAILEAARDRRRVLVSDLLDLARHALELHPSAPLPCWSVPPGPLCEQCGHQCAQDMPTPWCERFEADAASCCAGECVVDPYEFADWREQLDAAWTEMESCGWTLSEQAIGPFCPLRIRSENYVERRERMLDADG